VWKFASTLRLLNLGGTKQSAIRHSTSSDGWNQTVRRRCVRAASPVPLRRKNSRDNSEHTTRNLFRHTRSHQSLIAHVLHRILEKFETLKFVMYNDGQSIRKWEKINVRQAYDSDISRKFRSESLLFYLSICVFCAFLKPESRKHLCAGASVLRRGLPADVSFAFSIYQSEQRADPSLPCSQSKSNGSRNTLAKPLATALVDSPLSTPALQLNEQSSGF
jgi:hypothetical protein